MYPKVKNIKISIRGVKKIKDKKEANESKEISI